jgi:hypothetical protein
VLGAVSVLGLWLTCLSLVLEVGGGWVGRMAL